MRKALLATCAVIAMNGCTPYDAANFADFLDTLSDVAAIGLGVAVASQPQSGLTRTYCNGYGGHGGSYTYVCQ